MTGLQKILKMHGKSTFNGVLWVWDYANDKPTKRSEMTNEQWTTSEKAKWAIIKKQLDNEITNP